MPRKTPPLVSKEQAADELSKPIDRKGEQDGNSNGG